MTLSEISLARSHARRRLLELIRQVEFGSIQGLVIRAGEPVFRPSPRVVRDVSLVNAATRVVDHGDRDRSLEARAVSLFGHLDAMGTGTIEQLHVEAGLPCHMTVEVDDRGSRRRRLCAAACRGVRSVIDQLSEKIRVARPVERGRRSRAERSFALWYERGCRCQETSSYLLERGHLRQASFDLFQATEAYFGAALLVFVGDKPWTHDLRMLRRTAAQCDPLFAHVFPDVTSDDDRLFRLLNDACMGARYDVDFSVTADDLRRLHERVRLLGALTDRVCRAKLERL